MRVQLRVSNREIAAGDIVGGFEALAVHPGKGSMMVKTSRPGAPLAVFLNGRVVEVLRDCPELTPCPECGDPMSVKRTDERALAITNGVCSECVAYPRRHAEQVERDRRVAAYGEGRC